MAIVRLAYKLSEGANYLDLAQSLSLTERRLVHQKQVFTVMGGMIVDDSTQTLVKISTAPNNFYTRNAVTRGFRAWKKSRAKALEASGDSADDITAKYADFKVYLDQGGGTPLRPFNAGSQELTGGEWVFSKIVPEQGPAKGFMIVGRDHTASLYSLAKGWLETRPTPPSDPDMPDINSDGTEDFKVDFLNTMFQDTVEDSERMDRIRQIGDDAPYPYGTLMTTQSAYDSSSPRNLQLQFISHASQNEVNSSIPGFQALCGLVRIDVTNDTQVADPFLIIDVETKGWNF
jgi:hypothetical protein